MNIARRLHAAVVMLLAATALAPGAIAAEGGEPAIDPALRAQVLLARARFSPGLIDGRWGRNTEDALLAYRKARGLGPPERGEARLDDVTRRALEREVGAAVLARFTIEPDDVDGPYVDRIPDDLMEQSRLERLAYTSPMERLCERLHASAELLESLNPRARFAAGETIVVPAIPSSRPSGDAPDPRSLTIQVSSSEGTLRVLDGDGEVAFYAPATAGSEAQPLPAGEWEVVGISRWPTFHYDPSLFGDAPPDHPKAVIAAGPNNPVGVVWIGLSAEHYGIHGTPEPAEIGYTASHGCIRLTNWDASYLSRLVAPGTRVELFD